MMVMLERFARPLIGGLFVLVALIGLIGSAIQNPKPHDIAVGLVGPPPAVQQIESSFGTAAPGAFQFTAYASERDARAALDARTVDGVVLLGASPKIVVAGAAGDAATGVITAAFTNALTAQGAAVTIETVHPFAGGDAHGLVLFFVVVAALIATLVAQVLLSTTAKDAAIGPRLAFIVVFGALVGLTGMGTAAWIVGGYGDGFWAAAGLVALASAAVGAVIAGSARLLGPAGIALSALVVVILDLVSSGGPVGSQLLPDFYRWLAPWMPAGQLYDAMRGALFFDGAALAIPIAVLAGWLLAGLVFMGLGELPAGRNRKAVAVA
ncbi:MAG TPA: hypothetical protein VG426_12425 [Candidatus Dormibacteraeota bacterium]|nr:hypothetical protein [Candidatus Dormibacteraeota bacterium]